MTYNLLEEPWIPVLWSSGKVERVGIKQALTQAGRIRQIAASNPMDNVAILRFLLALLYWCRGNPPTNITANSIDSFPANWFTKLDDNRECFNLLGEGKRFYQYKKGGDTQLTANYLIHEIPTGTNWSHFRHSTDEVDGLCPACCAMGLLRLPLFSTSGGRGKPPGINQKPPFYAVPVGRTLAKTLRLSWEPIANLGTPTWEKPDLQLPRAGEVPFLTGLTWLPRRVWLSDPEESEAYCILCGRKENLIRSSVFGPIGSTKTDDDSPGRVWRDPHVIYEESNKGEVTSLHARDALGAPDAASGQWTNIIAGINQKQQGHNVVHFWVVGFSTVQNDKYLEATESMLPPTPSEDQGGIFNEIVERWQKETSSLIRRLRPPNDRPTRKHLEIPPLVSAIRPHVEHTVSAKAGELLSGGDAAWEKAAQEYRPMMKIISQSLSPGFTTAAVQRRRRIACVLPDMSQKTAEVKKPAKGKRGAK